MSILDFSGQAVPALLSLVERHWYRLTLTGNNKYVYTLIKSTLLLCGEKTLCCVTLISNTVQLTGDIPAQFHCCVCLQSVMKGG